MKRWFSLALIAVCCLSRAVVSQESPPDKDVPPRATDEIARRGEFVERTGLIRASADDAIASALALPPDDSNKWFVTILSDRGPACEQLQADFAGVPALRAFANPADAKTSWSHYNVYFAGDKTQEWRFIKLQKPVFPILLIQPPRTKQYGDPSNVVWQWNGYDRDPQKRAGEIRERIVSYVRAVYAKTPNAAKAVVSTPPPVPGGFREGLPAYDRFGMIAQAGAAPPFSPQPANPAPQPTPNPQPFPFDFPPLSPATPAVPATPPPPAAATILQLKAALPMADDSFLILQLSAGVTVEQAVQNWERAHPTTPTPAKPPSVLVPAKPEIVTVTIPTQVPALADEHAQTLSNLKTILAYVPTIFALFASGNVAGLVGIGLLALRTIRANNKKPPLLNDAQFATVSEMTQAIINQLMGVVQTTPPPGDAKATTLRQTAVDMLHTLIARLHGAPTPAGPTIQPAPQATAA